MPVPVKLPGRVSAYLVAAVVSRVDGIVRKREFVEGGEVKAGQWLYQVDPVPYITTLNSAKATLAKAQASLVSAHAQTERYKVLVASEQDYDNAVAADVEDAADVEPGKASVDAAQINLGYTDITSPITGRMGKSAVRPDACVQASAAATLSTVPQPDPGYVDLTQSSPDGLKLRCAVQEEKVKIIGPNAAKVALILEDGRPYTMPGEFEFSDVTVDRTTGSVTVRCCVRD